MITTHGFHERWLRSCVLAVGLLTGATHALLADEDHRRDRDRRDRDGEPRVQITVNVGGSLAAVQPTYIVDNRGPIHEAFAEPVVFNPKAGLLVSLRPPALLHEVPPQMYPEGDDVHWIPGYWGWDDDRADFVWISGIWRNIPPGRQFVPGYWCEAQGGYQWVPGCWRRERVEVVQYLPAPPESLDPGEPGVPPAPGSIWVPGVWQWSSLEYVWRPGFWMASRPDWVWVPDHYVWTPRGFVFVHGYWDYVLPRRGVLFAPVYLPSQGPGRQVFVYTPEVVVNTTLLTGAIFARPHYDHYYFGDYYDRSYFRSGIYPVVSFHNSRYGYDPTFAQCAATKKAGIAEFIRELRDQYRFRRDHPEARPPRTYSDLQKMAGRRDAPPHIAGHVGMAEPLSQIVNHPSAPFRFKSMPPDRVSAIRQTETRVRQYVEERRRMESQRTEDTWKGAVFSRSDRFDRAGQTVTRDRSAQPSPRAPQPTPAAAQQGPARVTELRVQRSPLGSRARTLLELLKPTPSEPKAPAPDKKVKPGSRTGIRREPQE